MDSLSRLTTDQLRPMDIDPIVKFIAATCLLTMTGCYSTTQDTQTMPSPIEQLLDNYDRITECDATFRGASGDDPSVKLNVATYSGFPSSGCSTSFTVGLFRLHDGGAPKELTISMRGAEEVWELACGYAAKNFWRNCQFNHGDIIDFEDKISSQSEMSAFVVVTPINLSSDNHTLTIGSTEIRMMQVLPIYEQERVWLSSGGDVDQFLQSFEIEDLMNSSRPVFSPNEERGITK